MVSQLNTNLNLSHVKLSLTFNLNYFQFNFCLTSASNYQKTFLNQK